MTTGQVSDELFEAIEPLVYGEPGSVDAARVLVDAYGLLLEDIAAIVNPDPDVRAPWSLVYDLEACPAEWLPWLAQWVGVHIPAGLDEESTRLRIAETDGFRRGSIGALQGAARQHLIGERRALVRERFDPSDPGVDSPYHLQVVTYSADTPDAALVEAALLAQKPGGIVLHYEVRTGQDYAQVEAAYADYAAVDAAYATYENMRDDF